MDLLTRDQILAKNDRPTLLVTVKEWGGQVMLRALTADERDEYEMAMFDARAGKGRMNPRARLVAMSIVNEKGERLFRDDDVERLGAKSGRALDRLFENAKRLSAIGPDAHAAALGSSDEPDGGEASSGSPSTSVEPHASSSAT